MKRLRMILLPLLLLALLFTPLTAHAQPAAGEPLGNVLHTDIRVFIDGAQIMGYNIDGHTYIVVEDLSAYGFAVIWDGGNRRIGIMRGASAAAPAYIPRNLEPVGSVAFPYVHTDIAAYIGGYRIHSYNIQGRTVIRIDDLADAFGRIIWDGQARELHVIMAGEEAEQGRRPSPIPSPTPRPTPAPSPEPQTDNPFTDFEALVLELINTERINRGLPPFIWHIPLSELAEEHSRDMAAHNTITHAGSDGSTLDERANRAGIGWAGLGINAAGGQRTPGEVVSAWMGSEGHRENILYPDFAYAGVGFYHAEDSVYRHHWTLKFLIPPAAEPVPEDTRDFEARVFELTNAERAGHGLAPFISHTPLSQAAREHSRDMALNGFVSHTGSDGSSLTGRVNGAGINWAGIAENVAGGQRTPEEVVEGWMNSPGHRVNILNPDYTHLGVGFYYSEGSPFRFHWTQKFLLPR